MDIEFTIHPAARASIDAIALEAFAAVRSLDIAKSENRSDEWWVPEDTVTITAKDIVGDPIAWLPQVAGGRAYIFIWQDRDPIGLTEDDYRIISRLTGALLKVKWVQKSVSAKYILNCFIKWARDRFLNQTEGDFSDIFLDSCKRDVAELTVWAPVQHMKVEAPFAFGSASVVPLDRTFFDKMRSSLVRLAPERSDDAEAFMRMLQKEFKDCSAITLKIFAEPEYAKEAALNRCGDAIGLLRFFCAATITSTVMSPVTLLGALSIPESHIVVTSPDGGISYTSGIKIDEIDRWMISKKEVELLEKERLQEVGKLLDRDELSDFQLAVRSSVLAFSRAITFTEVSDRLVFAFSAIEGLLLRNASEPIQQNVGERIAFLTAANADKRYAIVENFRKAYRMRSQYIHHRLTEIDLEELDQSFINIRAALTQAIAHMSRFKTRDEFLEAIDRTKFGG
ncbi:hypothetical protein GCM10010520_59650 [Rhizobium viscosum]|uniref:Apea-like HEPN domain-containing protein n=1 Tax=Rhizobium viscosum TaxID=1673 RepID=A0ABR9ITJ4_RHIVS|nr:HEPN domain-containing protein [Rhizobium viscosum]MBE1506520.1 hypothetical protein [Rhizobium viscosum]